MNKPAENSGYNPNHIPPGTRILYCVLSSVLLVYGAYGLWIDDLFIPGRRSDGMHLTGLAAWLMFAAIGCAALNMLSVVIDHFDRRDNEVNYKRFGKMTAYAGFTLFGLSIAAAVLKLAAS